LKIHFTPGALAQLDEILSYIADANVSGAEKVADRIDALVRLLEKRPGIGRPIPGSSAKVLSVTPHPYVIFFRVNEQRRRIDIIRIRHTRRRPLRNP